MEQALRLGNAYFQADSMCHIDFNKSAVVMAWRELACVDRLGRPLVGKCRWYSAVLYLGTLVLQFAAE